MRQNYDFHIHSNCSDGEYTVGQLVEKLRKENIHTFSITDHDNLNSALEIQSVDLTGMNYITGIELSTKYRHKYNMHILGYFIDVNNPELNQKISWLKMQRRQRIVDVARQVSERCGIQFSKEDIDYLIQQNNPGRPHIANLLIKYGYVKDAQQAFETYLFGLHSKFQYKIDAIEAIRLIHQAGGIAVWAHPKKVEKEYKIAIDDIIDELIEDGLDGIEIGNCLHSYDDLRRYQKLARSKNLLTSAGSDYHGPTIKPKTKLGVIDNSNLEEKIELEEITIIVKNKEN